jgi:signal peptidase II
MTAFAAGLLLVPLADQTLKLLLRRRLGAGSVPLGRFGTVRIVPAQIWLAVSSDCGRPGMIWAVWVFAAAALTTASVFVPACRWCAALLLGGSFSHALETTCRGNVYDYICLRFWPAFNLADVAITAGAVGVVLLVIKDVCQ